MAKPEDHAARLKKLFSTSPKEYDRRVGEHMKKGASAAEARGKALDELHSGSERTKAAHGAAMTKTVRRDADDLVGGSGQLAFHAEGGAAHKGSPATAADVRAAVRGFASQKGIEAPDNAQEGAGDEGTE